MVRAAALGQAASHEPLAIATVSYVTRWRRNAGSSGTRGSHGLVGVCRSHRGMTSWRPVVPRVAPRSPGVPRVSTDAITLLKADHDRMERRKVEAKRELNIP